MTCINANQYAPLMNLEVKEAPAILREHPAKKKQVPTHGNAFSPLGGEQGLRSHNSYNNSPKRNIEQH